MSFFNELKRRNVIRVGIAYMAGAWLLVQVADIILEAFEMPEMTMRLILVLLAIGLPVVMFISWVFELTPEGIKREKDVDRSKSITSQTGRKLNNFILGILAASVVFLLYDKFFGSQPEKISRQSIAVLPFDNRTRLEEDAYFIEGIHDDLLNNLAHIGSLKVISRTSVNTYGNSELPLPQIAQELGVANVLEGAVQRSGDTVHINVQLIDAQTDELIWAKIFERELTAKNLFSIQSEISKTIADELAVSLSPVEQKRVNSIPTESLVAYDAYLRGNKLLTFRTAVDIEKAVEEFQKAVSLDPKFALAWVGVANSHLLAWNYGNIDANEAYATMEKAAMQALLIDPNLGEAYAVLGQVYGGYYKHYEEMEKAFEKAIKLSPNYATAWHWYSIEIAYSPLQYSKSIDLAERAVELDPQSSIIQVNLAIAYSRQGLYFLSEQQNLKTVELHPGFAYGRASLASLYLFNMGRLDDAYQIIKQALEIDPDSTLYQSDHAYLLLQLGDIDAAEAILLEMKAEDPDNWRTDLVAMEINLARKNFEGMRESAEQVYQRVSREPFFDFNRLTLPELVGGNVAQAREIYLTQYPGWTEPSQWQRLIEQWPGNACPVAWTLLHSGDEELAQELLQQALVFHETVLPGVIENAERYRPDICYAMAGDTEKVISSIETLLKAGHLYWQQNYDLLPVFDQIRHDPRYQAAMNQYRDNIAEQRERVAQLNQ